jgi:hypothetical protein
MFDEDAFDTDAFDTEAFFFDVIVVIETPSGGILVNVKGRVNKDMELFKMVISVINVIQR